MIQDDTQKLTREEQQAAIAAFKGTIQKIETGKRTRRGPSKKPGQSGSLQGAWTEKEDRLYLGVSSDD